MKAVIQPAGRIASGGRGGACSWARRDQDRVGGADVAALCRHVKPGGRIRTVATAPIDPAGLPSVPEFVALHADAQQLAELVAAVSGGVIPFYYCAATATVTGCRGASADGGGRTVG